MIINHNMKAINAHRMMGVNAGGMGKSIEKLSSGLRINRAADDAAGLAISEKMRSQIRGMQQASRNAQDGISVVQTAEGALDEVHSMLQRMKQLAVQSANDSNQSQVDREALQLEVDQLTDEINSITEKTQFNKMRLLDGTFSDKKFHVGANQDETIGVSIKSMTAKGLGLKTGGTEELPGANAETRTIVSKGTQKVTTPAGKIAKDATILTAAEIDTKVAPPVPGKKVIFKVEFNGKFGQFELEPGADGKIAKGAFQDAAFEALKKLGGEEFFKKDGDTIKAAKDILSPDGIHGASAKITVENEHEFQGMAQVDAMGLSMANVVLGDKEKAVAEISFEVGYQHLEISLNGDVPKTVVLTKDDVDAAAVTKKFKAVFGDAFGVEYTPSAGGAGQAIIKLTTKEAGKEVNVHIRATGESGRTMVDYRGVNILNREAANKSINNIQQAIETLASRRAELGAIQNRIEHTIKNLDNSAENLQAAESRVRDVDMADEMSKFTKANILTQASQAMLAQANQLPQQVLQLLR